MGMESTRLVLISGFFENFQNVNLEKSIFFLFFKDEEMMIGAKLADAIDKSAAKSSQLAQFLSIQDLKSMSLPELATFLSQTLAETGGPNSEGLAKALALQAVLSNSNSDPIKLAKSLRVTNGLVKAGVPKSTVSRYVQLKLV